MVAPSDEKNSWPAISMFIVRVWIFVRPRAVGADRPDAVHLVPGALVAEHDEVGIGGRELQMAEPLVLAEDVLQFAGLRVDSEQDARRAGARGHQRIVQAQIFGVGVGHRLAVGAHGFIVGLAETRDRRRAGGWPSGAGGGRAVHIRAEQQGLVGIQRRDIPSRRQFDDLARGAGVDIGRVDDGGGIARSRSAARALGVIDVAASCARPPAPRPGRQPAV